MKIKFFADTASHEEIEYCFSRDVNDGVTTNPKIMEIAGVSNFEEACRALLAKYRNLPISLETDLRGISVSEIEKKSEEVRDVLLQQARQIANWAPNAVVKIPICSGGILAVRQLAKEGIKTNVTACMTPYQALFAAKAGATYVSLFSNRMLDSRIIELSGNDLESALISLDWKKIIEDNKEKYTEKAWNETLSAIAYVADVLEREYMGRAELIVGSIRTPADIHRLVTAQPQIITIPHKIVQGLEKIAELKQEKPRIEHTPILGKQSLSHPMTSYTLEEFEKAADSYRSKSIA